VLAALAALNHGVLRDACYFGNSQMVALLAAAYGPPGCAALRGARSLQYSRTLLTCLLHIVFSSLTAYGHLPDNLSRFNATLAALLAVLGEPDCASALHALGAWMTEPYRPFEYPEKPVEPAQRLARIPPDSLLAHLAVATPAAWALDPDAARALLSAPVR